MSAVASGIRSVENEFFKPEDPRVYAVVRMAFACVALLNLWELWPFAPAFFSEAGMIDAEVARRQGWPAYLSIFEFAQSPEAVQGVLWITFTALCLLFCGIWTRVAALWVLIWHVSFTSRALVAATGWDMVLRSFSFLVLVSPRGDSCSLHALWRSGFRMPTIPVAQYGLVLMRLQVATVYWQTVLHRTLNADRYWLNGEFLSYFLLSSHSRMSGAWVRENESLLHLFTHLVQLVEVAIPVLLWVRRTRWTGILTGVLLHGGICISAKGFELFFLTMIMSYTCFLDRTDMDRLQGFLARITSKTRERAPLA